MYRSQLRGSESSVGGGIFQSRKKNTENRLLVGLSVETSVLDDNSVCRRPSFLTAKTEVVRRIHPTLRQFRLEHTRYLLRVTFVNRRVEVFRGTMGTVSIVLVDKKYSLM